MGKTSETHDLPLLQAQTADSSFKRTGNLWTAVAHIITAVIGSGALSLAWSTAQLGWIAGPLAVLSFAAITLVSSFLLSNCYRTPDPEHGPGRNRSYIEAVDLSLGMQSSISFFSYKYVSDFMKLLSFSRISTNYQY
ncbi:probable amino acid permease 7 [Pistacia vera]|uniref:probable amino acid permease 7 n=1 Tax=Pistacia vera TaxID=55513 RepID=UPI0012631908|nr:probable amino acid permease 7 [Pistacia vera]